MIDWEKIDTQQNLSNYQKLQRFLHHKKSQFDMIIYHIKCYFKPFNVLKIQALPRSWRDRDAVLFHAAFQVLRDFVETEHPYGEIITVDAMMDNISSLLQDEDDDESIKHYCDSKKIIRLYGWYVNEWPTYQPQFMKLLMEATDSKDPNYKVCWDLEEEHDKKIDEMLRQLIDVRSRLWT